MRKALTLLLTAVLVLYSLVMVGCAFAQSVPKPSVPEFTVELVEHSYDVPPVYGIDQFTGENVTIQEGAHYQWNTLNFTIRNQQVPSDYNLYYNIRYKGQYTDDWTELFYGDRYMRRDEGEYSSKEFLVSGSHPSPSDIYGLEIPMGATVEFQVEAMIGGIYSQGIWFSAGDAFEGEVSGWSETQTLTIEEVPPPTPSPEATPIEPALILGVIGIVAVFVFGLVLLYRIKRK